MIPLEKKDPELGRILADFIKKRFHIKENYTSELSITLQQAEMSLALVEVI